MAEAPSSPPAPRQLERPELARRDVVPHPDDLSLRRDCIDALKPGVANDTLESLTEMDEPKNMPLLKELADLDAAGKVDGKHFPAAFDLS